MTTGVAALDADHKQLIVLINTVEQALSGAIPGATAQVLDGLAVYVDGHFAREEKVLDALNFPDSDAHKKGHQDFCAKLRAFDAKYKSVKTDGDRRAVGTVLNSFLQDWLVNHVLKEDLKIKPLIAARPKAPTKPAQSWIPETQAAVQAVIRGDDIPPAPKVDRNRDVEYSLPPELQRLLSRLEYVVPELPPPEGNFESFDKLCEAAILRRLDKVLVFFQRYNPELDRILPPFFLASPEFAVKFHVAVMQFIFPVIWESRQIRVLSSSFDWANNDTETFWKHVDKPMQQVLLTGWNTAWDNLKLVDAKKPDGTRVVQVKATTKELREMLQPSSPEIYDLPKIGNVEIETFKSFLDPAEDWSDLLARAWQTCHDLYEQEKDPRVFQQKAREGALRDNLLAAFNRYPERWVDFLVLACHRVFPRISCSFLAGFTRNLGRTEAEREVHMPYTVRYLRQAAAHPEIAKKERDDEDQWEEEMTALSNYLKGAGANANKPK